MTNTHLPLSLEIPLPNKIEGVSSRPNLKIATKILSNGLNIDKQLEKCL